jgi:hypothetical protein
LHATSPLRNQLVQSRLPDEICARWKTVSLHGTRGKPGCATRDDTFALKNTKSVGRMIVIVSSYRASSAQTSIDTTPSARLIGLL